MIPTGRQLRAGAVPAREALRPDRLAAILGADVIYLIDDADEIVAVLHGEAVLREIENGRLAEFKPVVLAVFSTSDPRNDLPVLSEIVRQARAPEAGDGSPTLSWPPVRARRDPSAHQEEA